MFADTDFILALIKESDWLKGNASKIFNDNKGNISSSVSVMIEVALICKRFKINTMEAFANIFELINIDEFSYSVCLQAAFYIEKFNANVFDSFHAAYCADDTIISSDKVYDRIGLKRARLEKS